MSNKIALPSYLAAMIDNGEVDENADGLISQGGSVPRISLKGRMFRYKLDGEEIEKTNGPVHFVILGVTPESGHSKTYYKDGYQPDSSDPPDCSSTDGVRPDSWVSNPCNQTCIDCPMNSWGSAKSMSGKKAKACKDSKRLYVVDPKDIDGNVYLLTITVSSLKALTEYGRLLKANRIPIAACITTVAMADSEFPQLEFGFAGILKEEQGKKCIELSAEKAWEQPVAAGPALDAPQSAESAFSNAAKLEDNSSTQSTTKSAVQSAPSDVDSIINNWSE